MAKKGFLGDIVFSSKEMKEALHANADGTSRNYVGLNDDLLNMGEAESFIDESEGAKVFSIRMVNNTESIQKIQFNPILEKVADHNLLKEGNAVTVGDKHLTVAGDPRSVDVLLAYIASNPIRVRSIKFNVSDEGQLDEPMKFIQESAFVSAITKQVVPSNYQDQKTTNTKTVEVDFKDWILGNTSTILYSLRPGASVNLTLYFGASLDTAEALRKKHNRATRTAAEYFARQNGQNA